MGFIFPDFESLLVIDQSAQTYYESRKTHLATLQTWGRMEPFRASERH
jgi:hypothetical protein